MSESLVTEVTADEKYAKQYDGKLDRDLFDKAVELDPTSNGQNKVGKYTDWIIKNQLFDVDSDQLHDLLNKFTKYKNKIDPSKRDINKLSYEDLQQIIAEIEKEVPMSKKEKKNAGRIKAEKESEVLFNNDKYIVVSPKTQFASCFYGAGADWCTARQDKISNMFYQYNRDGKLYIILNKKTKEKYQLYKNDEGTKFEYKNSSNESFNPYAEFDNDNGIINWLDENNFKNKFQITENEAEEYAHEFLNGIQFYKSDDNESFWNDAFDYLVNYFRNYNDMYDDFEDLDPHDIIKDDMGDLLYEYEKALEFLTKKYAIDPESSKNKTNMIFYLDRDMLYEVEHNFEMDDLSNWDMLYENSLEEYISTMSDDFDLKSFNDLNMDIIKDYLEYTYETDIDRFRSFYDDFVYAFEKHVSELTDKEKEYIRDYQDKIEKTLYNKDDHPKLDLQSFRYANKALRYL